MQERKENLLSPLHSGAANIMVVLAWILWSAAFAVRALWATRNGASARIRSTARWRAVGWTALAILLSLALRPTWHFEGVIDLLILPLLAVALWVMLDPKVRSGGRGTWSRTLLGIGVVGASLFTLFWFRLGPSLADRPLLILELTGETEPRSLTWQMPGSSPRTETLPLHRVLVKREGSSSQIEPHWIWGDVLSVRAQRVRLWWPLELLGFPPVIWIDGLRAEALDPAVASATPAQFIPLTHPSTLLGPSLQSWCQLVWQKAFRGGYCSWWMESAQLETAGISVVDAEGKAHRSRILVQANSSSLQLVREELAVSASAGPPAEKGAEQSVELTPDSGALER